MDMIQKQLKKSKTCNQKQFSPLKNSLLSIKDLKNSFLKQKKYNESLDLQEMYETSINLSKNFESIQQNLVLSNLSSKNSQKSKKEIFDNWINDNAKKVKSPFDSCEEKNNFWNHSKLENFEKNSHGINLEIKSKFSNLEESDCVNMDINKINSSYSNKFDSNLFYDKNKSCLKNGKSICPENESFERNKSYLKDNFFCENNQNFSKNEEFYDRKFFTEESRTNNFNDNKKRKSVMIMKDHILKTKSSLKFEKKRYKSENRSKREFSKDKNNNFSKITHKIKFTKLENKSILFKNSRTSFISKEEDLKLNKRRKLNKNLKPQKLSLSPLKISDINISKRILKKNNSKRNSKFSNKTADRLIKKGLEYSKKRQAQLNKKLKEELKKCTFKPKTNFHKKKKDLRKTEIFFKIKSQNFREKKNLTPNQKIKKTSLSPNTPKNNTFNIYNTSLLSTKNNISYFKTQKKTQKKNTVNKIKKNLKKNRLKNKKKISKIKNPSKIELLKEIHEVLSYLGFIDKNKVKNVGNVELNKKDMIKILIRLNFLPNLYEDKITNNILSSEESCNEYSKLFRNKEFFDKNYFSKNENFENDLLIEEMWKLITNDIKRDKVFIKDLTLFILAIYGLSLNDEIIGNFDDLKIKEIENSFFCFKKYKIFSESHILTRNQNEENCKSLKMVEKNYRKTLHKAIFYKEKGLLKCDLEDINHSDFLDLKEKIKKIEINIKRLKENKKSFENCTFKPKINKSKKFHKKKNLLNFSKNRLFKLNKKFSKDNSIINKKNKLLKDKKNQFLKKTMLKIDIKISSYLTENIYLYPSDDINLKMDFLIKKHNLKDQQISKLKRFLKNQIKKIN